MTDERAIRIVLIDDILSVAAVMERTLRKHDILVTTFDKPADGLAHLAEHHRDVDVVLLDVDMPQTNGLQVLAEIKRRKYACTVVMWTADATALTATAAMRAGAFTYVTKPIVNTGALLATLHSAARFCALERHARALEDQVANAGVLHRLLGESSVMRELHERVHRLGRSDISVLIRGESGTGKELVARSLHDQSARADAAFVAVNCGAISDALIDSELFGHSKGAFTGAIAARPGLFVEADGGTLFLDEIAEMPMPVQARLLRVLQEREVRAVGADVVRKVDVRVIAATHGDLTDLVEEKRFRADLLFRLNVASVDVPPLRARAIDLPLLVAHFLAKHGRDRRVHVTPAALAAMEAYAWPGNVRELENALLHALALTSGDTIDASDLPVSITAVGGRGPTPATATGLPADLGWTESLSLAEAKRRAIDDFERRYVTNALVRTGGNLTEAARIAGLDRSNLRRVMTRLELDPDAFRPG